MDIVSTYSEIGAFARDWLIGLDRAGEISHGHILADIREIEEIETKRFHAFAGIGIWDLALRMAGWPDSREVWTGSCPCQPFSVAGKKKGTKDERHLWPEWFRLIEKHRPATIFGEQVASPAGRAWLDVVSTDLEALGYAVGAADLCAAGVGAPHIRQRLFFVAHAEGAEHKRLEETTRENGRGVSSGGGTWGDCCRIGFTDGKSRPIKPGIVPLVDGYPGRVGRVRAYGNAIVPQVAAEFISAFMETE